MTQLEKLAIKHLKVLFTELSSRSVTDLQIDVERMCNNLSSSNDMTHQINQKLINLITEHVCAPMHEIHVWLNALIDENE